jgi:hypothetical protein
VESPRNHQRKSWRRRRGPWRLETGERALYPGGPDLSGETPDQTCPVRTELSETDRVLNDLLDLLYI